MKSAILFVCVFSFVAATYAKDRTGSGDTSTSSGTQNKNFVIYPDSAWEFFETLENPELNHPDNKRNPNWPPQLKAELYKVNGSTSLSMKAFKEVLRNKKWQVAYHCNFAPAPTNKELKDGKNGAPYTETSFDIDKMTFDQELIEKKDSRTERTKYIHEKFQIENKGSGLFELRYEDDEETIKVNVYYLPETKETVLRVSGLEKGECPDGKPIEVIAIPKNAKI